MTGVMNINRQTCHSGVAYQDFLAPVLAFARSRIRYLSKKNSRIL